MYNYIFQNCYDDDRSPQLHAICMCKLVVKVECIVGKQIHQRKPVAIHVKNVLQINQTPPHTAL